MFYYPHKTTITVEITNDTIGCDAQNKPYE